MKRFDIDDSILYVGSAEEIRPIYKALRRAAGQGKSDLLPVFFDHARFRAGRTYGIVIEDGVTCKVFSVVSAETALRLVLGYC